jgi:hypothetical protein
MNGYSYPAASRDGGDLFHYLKQSNASSARSIHVLRPCVAYCLPLFSDMIGLIPLNKS